jgi:UDP-N-acetylmuramyl pentapeptide synthase
MEKICENLAAMKNLFKSFVLHSLNSLAVKRIKSETRIIGITGSVGKTTAKEAVVKILGTKFKIHANKKSFNSEFGIPLTILEEESGFSSATKWIGILTRSFFKSFKKLEIDFLILEMGVDKPGDMQALLQVLQPTIGVMLAVKPVHLAAGQFQDLAAISQEKGLLIANLPDDGVAILNQDDELVSSLPSSARKVFFSAKNPATITASDIGENLDGICATIHHGEITTTLSSPILGKHNLSSLLAAIAVGLEAGISLEECCKALRDFHLPPGRLNLLEGVNHSKIIDGSYNSNPGSCAAALKTLGQMETTGRKIALLGQMNELGEKSEALHREIGREAAKFADEVIGVFGDAKYFLEEAEKQNIAGKYFETATAAGNYLRKTLGEKDLLLVKGSQNKVRLEKAVAELLANPEDKSLLCRQETYWLQH